MEKTMDRKLLHMDVRNVYVSFVKRASATATDSSPLSAAYIRRQWYSHDQIQVLYEQLYHRTGASWWRVRPVISHSDSCVRHNMQTSNENPNIWLIMIYMYIAFF